MTVSMMITVPYDGCGADDANDDEDDDHDHDDGGGDADDDEQGCSRWG